MGLCPKCIFPSFCRGKYILLLHAGQNSAAEKHPYYFCRGNYNLLLQGEIHTAPSAGENSPLAGENSTCSCKGERQHVVVRMRLPTNRLLLQLIRVVQQSAVVREVGRAMHHQLKPPPCYPSPPPSSHTVHCVWNNFEHVM